MYICAAKQTGQSIVEENDWPRQLVIIFCTKLVC